MFEVLSRNKVKEDGHLMMSSIYEWHFEKYKNGLSARKVKFSIKNGMIISRFILYTVPISIFSSVSSNILSQQFACGIGWIKIKFFQRVKVSFNMMNCFVVQQCWKKCNNSRTICCSNRYQSCYPKCYQNRYRNVLQTVTQAVTKRSLQLLTSTSNSVFEQWARFSSNKIFGNDNNCEENHAWDWKTRSVTQKLDISETSKRHHNTKCHQN